MLDPAEIDAAVSAAFAKVHGFDPLGAREHVRDHLARAEERRALRRFRVRRVMELRRAGWKLLAISAEVGLHEAYCSRICIKHGVRRGAVDRGAAPGA